MPAKEINISKVEKVTLYLYTEQYNLTLRGQEDIVLSSEERSYYKERFGQCLVEFSQVHVTQTIGEGKLTSISCARS